MSRELQYIINSRSDKCVENGGKDEGQNRLTNNPKMFQVEVREASEIGHMIQEGEKAIECDIQVTVGGQKGDVREIMRESWKIKLLKLLRSWCQTR